MIHFLSRRTVDATCDRCAHAAAPQTAPSFDAAAHALRGARWHVTVSGRTYWPGCAVTADPRATVEARLR
jgi:hypothetical protein